VEEILTSLSKISSMTVIARKSTFAYKGKAVDVREVARELGVRYVVEGSVRQGANRLRITAQLIDSTDGSHLWAEKYDRVVEDIFDIQDEITKEIVTALRVKLTNAEEALLLNRGTTNVEAWTHCVQAMEHYEKNIPAENAKARELAEQATILDPDYAHAWALLGFTYWFGARFAFDEDAQASLARAAELAVKALALDETNSYALGLSMMVQPPLGKFDQALAMGKRLISLYPGSAESRARYAMALLSSGRPQESLSMMKDAMRLNPRHPLWYQSFLARALYVAGKPEESLEALNGVLAQQPYYFPVVLLRTGILAREGREKEAKEAMTDLRRINPNFRLAHVKGYFMMRDQDYVAAFTEALRKAGLPE
jgi:adenylate cyclase